MKKSFYKSGLILFLAGLLLSFTLAAQEVTKEYHEEYSADRNTTLDLNNRYGDIVIQSWEKNQVVIDIKVTVDVPGRDRAEKLLEMIDVEFSQSGNTISVKTVIDNKFSFSGWGGNRRFSINYNIKMPAATNLTLVNRYGNTDFDVLTGMVNIDVKYGDIIGKSLTRGNQKPLNRLVLAYGKGDVEEAGWLDLNVRYSGGLEITKSQALLVDSRYSKLRLGETSSIVGDSKYDNYGIDKINNLVLVSGYTTTNVGTLTKKLNFQGSYGSLNVDQVPSGFEDLEVDVRYLGVKLGIEESASYTIDGEASYGGIKFNKDKFRYERQIVENNSTEISGTVGDDESPSSKVKIKSSYGSVTLTR